MNDVSPGKCPRCGKQIGISYFDKNRVIYCTPHCRSFGDHPFWPRGKYNGQRIVGLQFKAELNIVEWKLLPSLKWTYGPLFFRWLCLYVWIERVYER